MQNIISYLFLAPPFVRWEILSAYFFHFSFHSETFFNRKRLLVWPVIGQCVKYVGDGRDAADQRNLLAS